MTYRYPLIAFAGYAGAGKDEAAVPLIDRGYIRCCFGDIIKLQVDPVVQKHFGFSAFTTDRKEKEIIRPLLETWGEVNYDGVMDRFFCYLHARSVNTRLVRVREATEWRKRGGVVWHIERRGCDGATDWERARLAELYQHGCIDDTIENNSTVDVLHWEILCRAGLIRTEAR